jgi:hypothetical protein
LPKPTALHTAFVMVFSFLKQDRKDIQLLSDEVAALRNALEELSGGKFQPILEKHRKRIQGKGSAVASADESAFDAIILRAKTGELF